MSRLYLFTLEIVPLEIGKAYDDLPSHLTLMSRFASDLAPEELGDIVRMLFEATDPVKLVFESTIELGPKKVTAHMISSSGEQRLHEKVQTLLEKAGQSFNIRSLWARTINPMLRKERVLIFHQKVNGFRRLLILLKS